MRKHSSQRQQRRGVAAVEFALVAAPLFLFVFASIEFNRALMVVQTLEEASRAGCRVAILVDSTLDEIEAEVERTLAPAGIATYIVTTQPSDISGAEKWAPISVTVTASFEDMNWLPMPNFIGEKTYMSSCTLPKEYSLTN